MTSVFSRAGRAALDLPRARPPRTGGVLVAMGAALGGLALLNAALARRAERRHPPEGRFVEVDGARVHVIERGTGTPGRPPVVLVHGNGTFASDYGLAGLTDRLAAAGHRVIALDRPGFGFSDRPRDRIWTATAQGDLVRATLDRLGVEEPVVLVGHSWGTMVALAHALDHRDRTAGLVLVSGYYYPSVRLDVPVLSATAVPVLGDVLRYTISPLLGWLMSGPVFRKSFAPAPVTSAFRDGFPTSLSLRPSQLRAAGGDTALMVPGAASLAPRYGELAGLPVAILAGDGDKIVSTDAQARRLAEAVPGADLRVIEGAGHMLQHLAPEEVIAAVRRVVARASSADTEVGVARRPLQASNDAATGRAAA